MNVIFLMQTYINVNNADAMYNSLVSEFVKNGHQVTIVASNEGKEGTIFRKEGEADVLRVRTLPLLNISIILKGLANILLSIQYQLAMKKHIQDRHFDLIFTPTPPITLTSLTQRLKRKHHSKVFLILRDIFPQNAVDIGMINKYGMMYKFFRKMEKKLYVVADAIGCMTQGNIDYIKTNNTFIEPGKLHLLPNWIKPGINNQIIDQKLLEKYGLKDKFIVIFGGNLGIAQKVENIITLSKLHADKNDLVFLVIGKGTHKRYLENLIKKGKIKNILIIDFLKRTKYESFVSLSQVGFISLNENFTIPNVPSRILSYYNFKKPVFAIVDPVTDFGKMIEEDQSGFCCVYGDYKSYVDKFNQLYYDSKLRERLGNNGYSSLYNKYTPQRAYKKIAEILSI